MAGWIESPPKTRSASFCLWNGQYLGQLSSPRLSGSLIRLVDVVDGHYGQIPVVTEVAEDDLRTSLYAALLDLIVRDVEADWHTEEVAVCQALLFDNAGEALSGYVECVVL